MRVTERSEEEEPVIKKTKLNHSVENCCEVSMLSQCETVVDVNDGSCKNDICVELESDDRKIEEASSLSLIDAKHIDTKVSQDTGIEEKKVEFVSDDANIEKVAVVEVEKNNGSSVTLAVRSSDEVSVIVNKDSCVGLGGIKEEIRVNAKESQDTEIKEKKVAVVSGDANIEKVPVLEIEKNNQASVTSAVTSRDEVSVIVKKDSCVGLGGIKEEIRVSASVLRKKLLVLDLNGLLADIVSPLPDCKADINIGRRAIFKRPFCEDFLKFCFDKFEVGIWSSRKRNNVVRITEFLLGDMTKKLLFCWDMSYCAMTTVGSLENRHKYIVFKDLNRLWEKHDPNLPWPKGYYNETNTVLLDDSPYKALLNPPYTAIFPHSYNHQNKTDTSLGNDGDLRLHLEKLVEAENVQDFIKKNPFGQEAITESSEYWEFYRDAIRMMFWRFISQLKQQEKQRETLEPTNDDDSRKEDESSKHRVHCFHHFRMISLGLA